MGIGYKAHRDAGEPAFPLPQPPLLILGIEALQPSDMRDHGEVRGCALLLQAEQGLDVAQLLDLVAMV